MYGEVENYCEVKNIIFIRETIELKYTHKYYVRSTYMILNTVRCCAWWNIRVQLLNSNNLNLIILLLYLSVINIVFLYNLWSFQLGLVTESDGLHESLWENIYRESVATMCMQRRQFLIITIISDFCVII